MKKVKRLLTIGVAVTLMFCMSLSFVGCKEKEVQRTIPDGRYEATNHSELTHYVYVGDSRNYDYFFEIEEDHVARYSSGMLTYQAKVVEKDDKIYFEGYKWITVSGIITDLIFGNIPKGEGSTKIYLVEYNPEERSITLELYEKGE